jgi:DNA (cytosine-5)-methyltransferase 1
MRFGSVCSGIEAASAAWNPLGWKAAWFSEIEPFPSAVLAHHHPDVPNLGDMTLLPGLIKSGEVEAPDVFCGGTPCQAFSVAGKRQSLDDARGNLSLTFCEIANAIDDIRHDRGEQPCIVFWENVPGVLSTKDNAFGCFLAQLCGGDEPLHAPDGWPDAGCVSGERRTAAWRILDAQYFGLAQRRRRVFVVASARNGFDPAAVLFEFDGVRRDTAPSREAGKVAPTIPARSTGGGGLGTDFDCDGGVITMAHGQGGAEIGFDRGPTLTCNHEAPIVAHTLRGEGYDASEDGTGRGTPLVPVARAHPTHDIIGTLTSAGGHAVPGNTVQDAMAGQLVPVAFHPTQDPISSTDGSTHALGCGSSGGQASVGVAYPLDLRNALRDPDKHDEQNRQGCGLGDDGEPAPTLTKAHVHGVATVSQVRRLTAEECEFLQGFPRGYTAIPWRKKPARECPDGPRYKSLGNSWAVPVVAWIGKRIHNHLKEHV